MVTALPQDAIVEAYNTLTLHRVPGPRSLSYLYPIALTFCALLTSPTRIPLAHLRYAVLPAIFGIQAYVWLEHQSFDVISMQTTLTTFALLGWYDVRGTFKRLKRESSNAQRQQQLSYPPSILQRAAWVGTLMISPQFKDFLIGQRTHDDREKHPSAPMSFRRYLRQAAVNCVGSYLLLDLTSYLIQSTGYFQCLKKPGVACESTVWSLFTEGFLCWVHVYAAASFLLAYLPSMAVLLVISPFRRLHHHSSISPVVLNRPFGPIASIWDIVGSRKIWGVRAFWGIFWHQNMRYVTSAPGLALASLVGLRKPSVAYYMLVVSQAFFWSGVIHAGMVPPLPLDTAWTATQLRIRLAGFFWLQTLGVALEMAVEATLRQPSPGVLGEVTQQASSLTRLFILKSVAFVWTWLFLMTTLWLTILPVGRELGWWLLNPAPFSLSASITGAFV